MFSRRKFLLASASRRPSPLELRVDYTATSLIDEGDERPVPGRLWRTSTALRHQSMQSGRPLTVIARLDRNVVWLAMADPPIAIESDLSALELPLDVLRGGGDMRVVRQGRERVNGLDTVRIRVERKAASGTTFSGYVWATDQGVVARLAGEGASHGRRGRTLVNFRDVQVGPLDPVLFEAPRGVQLIRVKGADLATLLEGFAPAGRAAPRR